VVQGIGPEIKLQYYKKNLKEKKGGIEGTSSLKCRIKKNFKMSGSELGLGD
jgi:hypothetical protein